MLRRKSSHPFLICSFIIHLIVALIMVRVQFEPRLISPLFDNRIAVDIVHLPRPEVIPREQVEPAPPPEPAPTPPEVAVPKPKPAASSDWLMANSLSTNQRTVIAGKMDTPITADNARIAPQPRLSTTARPPSKEPVVTKADLPQVESEAVLPPAVYEKISVVGEEADLSANSPDVGTAKLRVGRRRGEVLGGMPIGNSSGGGGVPIPSGGDNYIQMMTDLARNVADAATAHEIDLVFVIDKTGSMADNVRGIRAYIDLFFEHLTRAGHDTAAGLVTFADTARDKPKVRGVTTDHGKFKNWLYKIKFEGGGDLAESGLDALMAALHKIKFRRGTQRFFVLASDGAFHDADYDGRSAYSLDQVTETLQREGIRVDVIGLDFLPIKQIAWATGGTWRTIPGKGYLEHIPPTLTEKILSEFGVLGFSDDAQEADELVVYISRNPRPTWLQITWKVLNPLGQRCYGPFSEHLDISNDNSEVVRFIPVIDRSQFLTMPGIYTVIYRLENNLGHRSILRRVLDKE
ncbi:MAG: VWA domain-containing protein [Candidatus Poribacteria bacterium]|nr:VWA domain-containing protein [Candidatus Poribacteria bacterium]